VALVRAHVTEESVSGRDIIVKIGEVRNTEEYHLTFAGFDV
jgi:hypothetical protein